MSALGGISAGVNSLLLPEEARDPSSCEPLKLDSLAQAGKKCFPAYFFEGIDAK
jgi:hypothetical protein